MYNNHNASVAYVYEGGDDTRDSVDIITPSRIVSRTRGSESSPEPEPVARTAPVVVAASLPTSVTSHKKTDSTHSSELVQKTKCTAQLTSNH